DVACGNGVAVLISAALTWSGVHVGCCCSSSATAPDTTAVACEVPLPLKNRVLTTALGYSVSMTEPGLRSETIDWPGATRSTWREAEPREEKSGMVSSSSVAVPLGSSAPTEMTNGSVAGLSSDVVV